MIPCGHVDVDECNFINLTCTLIFLSKAVITSVYKKKENGMKATRHRCKEYSNSMNQKILAKNYLLLHERRYYFCKIQYSCRIYDYSHFKQLYICQVRTNRETFVQIETNIFLKAYNPYCL